MGNTVGVVGSNVGGSVGDTVGATEPIIINVLLITSPSLMDKHNCVLLSQYILGCVVALAVTLGFMYPPGSSHP